ncbi:hypothetical protein [Sinisalibacter aestuarii]|uniref:Cytochrome c domain-containing protein n=1 Tax=Sinisalibacter aestuarii TaxID=2949426 RepID=A0ABQ5LTX2_9RHOB|nr:hypothetical protein [Sinisalibacter aestuarii]GKY88424.1 hypothetical protein STA1M1_22930 [Sinisalibacter aestuarii]
MARERPSTIARTIVAAGISLAATVFWPGAAASDPAPRALASELRITLGDLGRLGAEGLPPRHAEGLVARIEGALGLLPWLLTGAGDAAGAAALAAWQGADLEPAGQRAALTALVGELAARHRLDLFARTAIAPPGAGLAEAQAIHETYCFGCHDDYGMGDPDEPLPSRDLRLMAQEEPGDIFLARLIGGVKGDESIAFHNPLTEAQILALYAYYQRPAP